MNFASRVIRERRRRRRRHHRRRRSRRLRRSRCLRLQAEKLSFRGTSRGPVLARPCRWNRIGPSLGQKVSAQLFKRIDQLRRNSAPSSLSDEEESEFARIPLAPARNVDTRALICGFFSLISSSRPNFPIPVIT